MTAKPPNQNLSHSAHEYLASPRGRDASRTPHLGAMPAEPSAQNAHVDSYTQDSTVWDEQRVLAFKEAFNKALDLLPGSLVPFDLGNTTAAYLLTIGFAHLLLDETHEALKFCKQALPIFEKRGNRSGTAYTLCYIGLAYLILDRLPQALEPFKEALPIFEDIKDLDGVGFARRYIEVVGLGLDEKAGSDKYEALVIEQIEALKQTKALDAQSLDKSGPGELSSGDTQEQGGEPSRDTEQGRTPMPEHMDVESRRLVESFAQLPPEQQKLVLADLERTFKQNTHAVLSPPLTPAEIANIPQWKSRKADGMPVDFLEKHYGQWLKRFGAPADRVYQDQIRHHNLELIHGIQNQLREAGEGEKVRDYLPTRSARTDAVIENYPEAAVTDPRIGARVYYRARRAAKSQASNQPRI